MKPLHKLFLLFILLPYFCFAGSELRFSVTNHSQSVVIFASTDWLDREQQVFWHQTKHSYYYMPPKNIYLQVASGIDDSKIFSSFYTKTDSNCDVLGLPPMREMTGPIYVLNKNKIPVRYKASIVHVTINDAPDSTIFNKHLICQVEVTE